MTRTGHQIATLLRSIWSALKSGFGFHSTQQNRILDSYTLAQLFLKPGGKNEPQ